MEASNNTNEANNARCWVGMQQQCWLLACKPLSLGCNRSGSSANRYGSSAKEPLPTVVGPKIRWCQKTAFARMATGSLGCTL